MNFRISVNISALAQHVQKTVEEIKARTRQEVERLSISAHAFIVAKAQRELPEFLRAEFLGKDNKNVRWTKAGDSIWVVEIDDSVAWIDEAGRGKVFMKWLLDKNPKAKTAKDGSRYAHIPFTQAKHTARGGKNDKFNNPKAAYEAIVMNTLKENNINLKRVEKNQDGSPKLGILHKVDIQPPGTAAQFPGMFSMARPPEVAERIDLPSHGGIFHLKGLVVSQRMNSKGKVVREAVTFRTISSKHEGEGRWMAPEIKPLGAMKAAAEYAEAQWDQILKQLEREFTTRT